MRSFTLIHLYHHGASLPDTDSGYLVSIIVGVALIIGGIILLRLQKHL